MPLPREGFGTPCARQVIRGFNVTTPAHHPRPEVRCIGEIRLLTLADLPLVMEIERAGYSHPWSQEIFEDCFKPTYRCFGFWHQGRLLSGYAICSIIADELHLLNLCVSQHQQRQGYARILLRRAIREAKALSLERIILEVRLSNAAARALYHSEGFEVIGRRKDYYPHVDGREDAIVMFLELPSQG